MKQIIGVLIGAAILTAGVTGSAFGGQAPETIHQRKVNQQKRIAQGVKSGSLTPKETAKIEKNEAQLNRQIAKDRASGGGLSPKERAQINHKQNKLSREIYNQKHDAQTQK